MTRQIEFIRRWQEENPEIAKKYRKFRFKKALSISRWVARKLGYIPCDATIEELEAAFTGKCHHCGKTEEDNGRKLGVDHDHNKEVDNFRGFLCNACNLKDVFA